MIIPIPASGAYDQKKMLAMMTSLRYAFPYGRCYNISTQILLSSMGDMHWEQYREFVFDITDDVKGCNWMWTMIWNVEKDLKNLCNKAK